MIDIRKKNFTNQQNALTIKANSYFDAGKQFGFHVHGTVQRNIASITSHENLEKARHMLHFAEQLVRSNQLIIGNTNVLQQYLDTLYGFCEGASIGHVEGAMLQAELESGCQTMFVQDKRSKSIGFLHTEENSNDTNLIDMYRYIDSNPSWNPSLPLPDIFERAYDYTMVSMDILDHSYVYFAYPGLSFGGPAMGYNKASNAFISVDTISPDCSFQRDSLWANAIASMALMIGTVEGVREMIINMNQNKLCVYGGYAIHIAHSDTLTMTSFEVGNTEAIEIPPDVTETRNIIVQPNFPRSNKLQQIDELSMDLIQAKKWDLWSAQFSLEMLDRREYLHHISNHSPFTFDQSWIEQISALMYEPHGNLETDMDTPEWKSFTGLLSPFVVGYAIGIFRKNESVLEFGKLFPHSTVATRPKLWYSSTDTCPIEYKDLYHLAISYDPNRTHPKP